MVTAGLFLLAIVWLWQRERSEWIFYLTVIFLSPAAALTVKHHEVMFIRYFLVSIAFGFIAVTYVLADLCRCGRLPKLCVTVLVLLFLLGNGANVVRLFKYGRGGYLEGLRYMADRTPGQVVTIASDNDFRNGMLVEYYERYLPPDKRIEYIPQSQYPTKVPMWVVLHCIGKSCEIFPTFAGPHGNAYELIKTFPSFGLSGWHWFVYQRQDCAGASPVDLNGKLR